MPPQSHYKLKLNPDNATRENSFGGWGRGRGGGGGFRAKNDRKTWLQKIMLAFRSTINILLLVFTY